MQSTPRDQYELTKYSKIVDAFNRDSIFDLGTLGCMASDKKNEN